jgi:cytochrome P450
MKSTNLNKLITPLSNKAAKLIPLDKQIRGMHLYQKTKRKVLPERYLRKIPTFVEAPIPDVETVAIEDIDVSNPFLFKQNKWQSYFKRLRDECPVHYQASSPFGPFWSVTRYEDIVFVDKHHDLFSAEPIISIGDSPDGLEIETFIAMDPPKHDEQRIAVQGVVAPKNLKELESVIRGHAAEILDNVPVGETFNWVEHVSVELTTRMLATLFDYPFDRRHKLPYWSDIVTGIPETFGGTVDSDLMFKVAAEAVREMSGIWRSKEARKAAGEPLGYDLISLLLSNDNTKDMIDRPMEFLGNFVLLLVGGNDTTRNSITGGVHALNQFPDEFKKLKRDPSLIPNMVSEIIRWQTPLAYMRRMAKEEVVLNGQTIKKGDKVLMWYVSGNRDERKIEQPDQFIIDRKNARNHLSFGFGTHRCMGNRLAEMQLRIIWEEILKRFEHIEVVGEPELVQSTFVKGYSKMMVNVTPIAH